MVNDTYVNFIMPIMFKSVREVISDIADTIVDELVLLSVQSNGLEGWKAHP